MARDTSRFRFFFKHGSSRVYTGSRRELARVFVSFLLAICPNPSRLTVYTGLRVNLHFLANDYIDNNGFSNDKNVFSKNCRCQLLFTKKYWQLNYLRKLLQHFANAFSLGDFSANSRRALALGVDGIHRNQCIIIQQEFARELGEISPSVCNFGVDAA